MYKVYQKSVRQTETFKDLQRIKDETQNVDMDEMNFFIKPSGTFYNLHFWLRFHLSVCIYADKLFVYKQQSTIAINL